MGRRVRKRRRRWGTGLRGDSGRMRSRSARTMERSRRTRLGESSVGYSNSTTTPTHNLNQQHHVLLLHLLYLLFSYEAKRRPPSPQPTKHPATPTPVHHLPPHVHVKTPQPSPKSPRATTSPSAPSRPSSQPPRPPARAALPTGRDPALRLRTPSSCAAGAGGQSRGRVVRGRLLWRRFGR